jgi:hypothetical protein
LAIDIDHKYVFLHDQTMINGAYALYPEIANKGLYLCIGKSKFLWELFLCLFPKT